MAPGVVAHAVEREQADAHYDRAGDADQQSTPRITSPRRAGGRCSVLLDVSQRGHGTTIMAVAVGSGVARYAEVRVAAPLARR